MTPEVLEAEKLMKNLRFTTKRYAEKYISPSIIRELYRQFSRWRKLVKNRNGWWISRDAEKRIYAFDSYLTHYLLERCFWMQYGDSDVVSELLMILFELDGHLGKIFHFRLLSRNPNNKFLKTQENESESDSDEGITKNKRRYEEFSFGSTWRNEIFTDELVKPVDYFIEHAHKKKLLFDCKRFAEQCIVQSIIKPMPGRKTFHFLLLPPCAMSFKFPDTLPKLLQHGLFVRAQADDENVGKLLTGIIGLYASTHFGKYYPDYSAKILRMGNMLLRSVESVNIFILMRRQRMRKPFITLPRIVTQINNLNILPKLHQRCYGPQELQHLCRCQIRRRLYDNWILPGGISFLPIPSRLKDYLNLQID